MAERADLAASTRASKVAAARPARAAARHERLEARPSVAAAARHSKLLDGRPAAAVQRKVAERLAGRVAVEPRPIQPVPERANRTGLPDRLKGGIESLSGLSLDDVRVHYGSSRPAALSAHAYTRGSEIHLGPGQEKHLTHEAWHVVQQKQGRVKPTLQLKGVPVNDDPGLEREADRIGARLSAAAPATVPGSRRRVSATGIVQAKRYRKKLNPKQEASRERLLAKQQVRSERYLAQVAKEKAFRKAWEAEVDSKRDKLLKSKEVKRYIDGGNLDEGKWDAACELLVRNLKDPYGDSSPGARRELQEKLKAPWSHKQVGRKGEEKSVSNMPPTIWNVIQEVFDARVVYRTQGLMLFPGGEGFPREGLEQTTPDYFVRENNQATGTPKEIGDAINLTAVDLPGAINQAEGCVTSKVAAYPGVPVTVVIGAHETPELLELVNVRAVRARVAGLQAKPRRVLLVSGSTSVQAYP